MPQFERFTAKTKVATPSAQVIDASVLGAEARALRELGSAGARFAGEIVKIEKEKKRVKDTNVAFDRINRFKLAEAAQTSAIRKQNLTSDEFKKQAHKSVEELSLVMKTSDLDPKVAAAVKKEVTAVRTKAILGISRQSDIMFRGEQRELFVRNLPSVEDEAIRAETPEAFIAAMEKHRLFIANNVGFGFGPEEARNVDIVSRQRILKGRGTIKIKANPRAILRLLDQGQDKIDPNGPGADFAQMRPTMYQDMKDLARRGVLQEFQLGEAQARRADRFKDKQQQAVLNEIQAGSVKEDITEQILASKHLLGDKFGQAIAFNNAQRASRNTGKRSDPLALVRYNRMATSGIDPNHPQNIITAEAFGEAITQAVIDGKIAGGNVTALLSANQARLTREKGEGRSMRREQVREGVTNLSRALKSVKQFGQTDRNAQILVSLAIEEFLVATRERPKELPSAIAGEIRERFLKSFRTRSDPRVLRQATELEGKSVTEVLKEWKSGKFGREEAERQINAIEGLESTEARVAARDAVKAEKARLKALEKENRSLLGYLGSFFGSDAKSSTPTSGRVIVR